MSDMEYPGQELEIFDKAKGSFWRKKFSKMENSCLSSTVSLYERNKKNPSNFLAGFFNNYLVFKGFSMHLIVVSLKKKLVFDSHTLLTDHIKT